MSGTVTERFAERRPIQNDSVEKDKIAQAFGYSVEDLQSLPIGTNLGVSCGNPLADRGMYVSLITVHPYIICSKEGHASGRAKRWSISAAVVVSMSCSPRGKSVSRGEYTVSI